MPLKARVCLSCHQSFTPSRDDQRFCRRSCKNAFHNAARRVAFQRGIALDELPVAKVLWEGEAPIGDVPQLSWARRELIMGAFASNRARLLKHLAQTLGVDRELLLRLERDFDSAKWEQ